LTLAAMAARTSRVTLGAMLTPPSRRRPWKLAREAMSVDRALTAGATTGPAAGPEAAAVSPAVS
jgi:alkanesulfonate monooxygenase SsuD/methylene tetrahydromethanopterin reductase-like flavin-dependent oxidoreductase (luciferase family)